MMMILFRGSGIMECLLPSERTYVCKSRTCEKCLYAEQIVHAARASYPRLEKTLAELRGEEFLSAGVVVDALSWRLLNNSQ
jgi:hypothetical protein